jgi:hypothetical protein
MNRQHRRGRRQRPLSLDGDISSASPLRHPNVRDEEDTTSRIRFRTNRAGTSSLENDHADDNIFTFFNDFLNMVEPHQQPPDNASAESASISQPPSPLSHGGLRPVDLGEFPTPSHANPDIPPTYPLLHLTQIPQRIPASGPLLRTLSHANPDIPPTHPRLWSPFPLHLSPPGDGNSTSLPIRDGQNRIHHSPSSSSSSISITDANAFRDDDTTRIRIRSPLSKEPPAKKYTEVITM